MDTTTVEIHAPQIRIRRRHHTTYYPDNPVTGDTWYDTATGRTWTYITLTRTNVTLGEWVSPP